MSLEIITDSFKSTEDCKVRIAGIRNHNKQAKVMEDEAAIQTIRHCQLHGDASLVNMLVDALDEAGTKGASQALRYLVTKTCGAKKDGTINKENQNKFKDTYEATLAAMIELGLTDYRSTQLGESKAAKTDEEKAQAKADKQATQAKAWLAEQAKTDAGYKVAMEVMQAYNELAIVNPSQANDQAQATIASFKKGLAGALLNMAG